MLLLTESDVRHLLDMDTGLELELARARPSNPVARATVLQRLYLDDMAQKSAVVVHATVLSSRAEWNASHSSIWTVYTVRAHQYLKGFLGETFEFREPGGTVGNVGMYVAGHVAFWRRWRISCTTPAQR